MTGRHGAGNGQKTKYNSHYETLRLNSRCRGLFIIMLTYYIYFLPVPTAVPVRVFHRLHPVHRFNGGLPLKPQPPSRKRLSPRPDATQGTAQGNAARRPFAAASQASRQQEGSCSAFRRGPPADDSRCAGFAAIIGGSSPQLQAQHFRRVSLCAVPCSAFPIVGGLP